MGEHSKLHSMKTRLLNLQGSKGAPSHPAPRVPGLRGARACRGCPRVMGPCPPRPGAGPGRRACHAHLSVCGVRGLCACSEPGGVSSAENGHMCCSSVVGNEGITSQGVLAPMGGDHTLNNTQSRGHSSHAGISTVVRGCLFGTDAGDRSGCRVCPVLS